MPKRNIVRQEYVRALLMGLAATGAVEAGAMAYATRVEPGWVEIRRLRLTLPRLHRNFHGYRVVQVSDFHLGEWRVGPLLDRAVQLVNDLHPDLIAVTGDFVTRTYDGADAELVPALRRFRAKDGVVAVLGNHDYWGIPGHGIVRRIINESGLIDLNNKVYTLDRQGALLHIAGVDSVREGMDRLDLVLKRLPAEGAALLLAHEPDFADTSAATGRFDLQLSGHSHGGQIVIPFVGPPHLPPLGRKYHTGLYKVGDMLQYTNRGLGVVGVPVRFWCRPEITMFTLQAPDC